MRRIIFTLANCCCIILAIVASRQPDDPIASLMESNLSSSSGVPSVQLWVASILALICALVALMEIFSVDKGTNEDSCILRVIGGEQPINLDEKAETAR